VLVLGSPRSGTTWLAKTIDSNPDILYRHEPDEIQGYRDDSVEQLARWIMENGVRAATKQPFHRKAWLRGPKGVLHTGLAKTLNGIDRLVGHRLGWHLAMYDFGAAHYRNIRPAIKLVGCQPKVPETVPTSRTVFIIRHPCGTIFSTLKGTEAGFFAAEHLTKAIDGEAMERSGLTQVQFDRLPLSGKLAWQWLAFNENAIDRYAKLSNVKIVVYEEMCRDPVAVTQDVFGFLHLAWTGQTAKFLERSTHANDAGGFYGVHRLSAQAASRWRLAMRPEDQAIVMQVLAAAPALAAMWAL
jgi:LPS sulfotransferase NodH